MSDAHLPQSAFRLADDRHREPDVGQFWFDKDHRVTSRYAKIIEKTPEGRYVIRRGVQGTGQRSTVSRDTLRKRFVPLESGRR